MDNMDDSENNAKVSDSAYSNSYSNSQSRRSHSSKSTHSGSNSSGSSGYGGKPSTSSSSNDLSDPKKEKELKKKKKVDTLITESQIEAECRPEEDVINIPSKEGGATDDVLVPSPKQLQTDNDTEDMEVALPDTNNDKEEAIVYNTSLIDPGTACPFGRPALSNCNGFSCVISMHDGVVLYATASLTSHLGFPKDMWVGRSFIDFVHPRDRNTFASQITKVLAIPKVVSLTEENDQTIENQGSTMVCRIRRYRGLSCGFGVKNTTTAYLPFLLKFRFKNINDDKGTVIYLVIQAVPLFSAFKTSNEILAKTVSFVMRHGADGNLEYIDAESVPYLGYLPQDITNRDALLLYHPGDLGYLQQVYESLVKEGNVNRSKTYRMMTQNGHYIKVETEWSAFINPWSKKLEFVTGKHYIIEGPANPDVFQNPENVLKLTAEQNNQAKTYRDGIIRIMKEVLTKPAEIAKQQMSKRCQDLALFMEILMEEQPKAIDELRLEIQDTDHSYYERDSVILGGISPHHEYDSKSSTETPLSYNQLNYKDNLQRYFNSHQSNVLMDNNSLPPRNPLDLPVSHFSESNKNVLSAMEHSGEVIDLTGSGESSGVMVSNKSPTMEFKNYHHIRLTESLLTKHNAEMEKELMKIHREHRCFNKGDREKGSNEARQKKKEHLARCNVTFQTGAVANNTTSLHEKPHNLKRSSKQVELEPIANKHHCPSSRHFRRKHTTSSGGLVQSLPTPTAVAPAPWSSNPGNNVNSFILGVGMQPPMPIMSPLPVVPGMIPMYYTPATASTGATTEVSPSVPNVSRNNSNNSQFQQPLAPCVMYGQPIYGSPIMYSPISPQSSCFQQTVMAQNMHYNNALNPLCLTNSNYEEACRASMPARSVLSVHRGKKRIERLEKRVNQNDQGNVDAESGTSHNATSAPENIPSGDLKPPGKLRKSEETMDRTDGESSYSSFYSSFFKTESGSAEDSIDIKKTGNVDDKDRSANDANTYNAPVQVKAPRRKMDPPWTEQVCVTSELIYKYQVISKPLEEVLLADKQKMKLIEQPSLVNDQLGQLYIDLQLQGVAARLTLEEGMTSSSSSGEEVSDSSNIVRKKREYSKLVMIYEENAPLPSAPENITPDTESVMP